MTSITPNAAPVSHGPAREEAPGTTEVVSAERLLAYLEIAHELGDISVNVVAQPGETMVIGRPRNPFRTGNIRDRGDFLGVANISEMPVDLLTVKAVPVPEDHYGIVVTSPLHEPPFAGDRHSLRDLYEGSNKRYDEIRAEQRKAKAEEERAKTEASS